MRNRISPSVWLLGLFAALLPLLALLEYRWIGQVSEAEHERLEEGLNAATARFTIDLYRELASLALDLQVRAGSGAQDLESQLARNHQIWEASTAFPGLIQDIYVMGSAMDAGRVLQFDPAPGRLEAVERPRELTALPARPAPAPGWWDRPEQTAPEVEGMWLMAPMVFRESFLQFGGPSLLLRLDPEVFHTQFLPALVAAHFDERSYNFAAWDARADDELLYRSSASLQKADLREPDMLLNVFAQPGGAFAGAPDAGRRAGGPGRSFQIFQRGPGFARMPAMFSVLGPQLQLAIQHRSGSLEAAVSALRRRNLGIGFGILALLGASGAMMVIWSERVRAIGRLQMEFAAGISHDLRTPLATIRAAAHNIASGVVNQPEQVREYADIVQSEGRRLSTMVDQVIQFAQTEAGRREYERQPVPIGDVVERSLGIVFATPEERRMKTRVEIDPALPPAIGDASALALALENLLTNALKFGQGSLIGVSARLDPARREIELSVSDSGPGIDPADRSRLFDAFYRGRGTERTHGSGLGLHLVQKMMEGQNGRVTVSSVPGEGATFTLHIPAGGRETTGAGGGRG